MSDYDDVTVEIVEAIGFDIDDQGWEHNAYTLRLHRPAKGLALARVSEEFDWKAGLGITTTPDETPGYVLNAVISDATAYLNADTFEEFAEEFGYDSDSRRAEAVYEACGEVAGWLEWFLGIDPRAVVR